MKIIIIGNGVAGISAVEAIRSKDKNSEIIIMFRIGCDPHFFPPFIHLRNDAGT